MRLTRPLSALAGAALLAVSLSSCGDSASAADPMELIQNGDFKGAIAAIEPQLETVAKGTDEHKELVLSYVEALAADTPDKAKDAFLSVMDENKDFMDPKDLKYVVNRMADGGHLQQAIDVMDKGKKTWPDDETMNVVLEELKTAITSSGDDALMAKLKSMGYLGDS